MSRIIVSPSKSALPMELLCQFQQFAVTSEENHEWDWENKAICGNQICLSPVQKLGVDHWTILIKIRSWRFYWDLQDGSNSQTLLIYKEGYST